ncbi:SNF2-related protein [Cryobacterium sp. TMT2-23]|uniref:DEAD/DEAH box helicase n=1 Tax=Cryobacterium sp. TMT2-23 TaxID=1259252 RepID=UPI00106C7B47|nr:SNF2-related protein [Cryobacterium sp. TMT2-23]TFD16673.1 helicase [Cryobacterium sp. TMT2-23]
MPYTLTSHEIALLVGSQAFSRGERYARTGHVASSAWSSTGTQLFGEVEGSSPSPYSVSVSFTVGASGAVLKASGVCTCPVTRNCKHVAALLVDSGIAIAEAARDLTGPGSPRSEPPTGPPTGPAVHSSPPLFPSSSRSAPRSSTPTWRSALAPLTRPDVQPAGTSLGLALQFQLLAPERTSFADSTPVRRLVARPMIMGKKGKWIRGSITWDNMTYDRGALDQAQLRVLSALYALHSAGRPYYAAASQWIRVDAFPDRSFWDLLEEARAARLALISATAGQEPVLVSAEAAGLQLDIRRSPAGLTLAPAVVLGDRPLPRRGFGFIGEPAHGVYSWEDVAGVAEPRLTLAPLTGPIDRELRDLAMADSIAIPPADEPAFLAEFYPFLRNRVSLTSRDDSFQPPESPQPVLALTLTHQPDARITLHWDWRYPGYRQALRPTPNDTRYRDTAGEERILRGIRDPLVEFPGLVGEQAGRPLLIEQATLAGPPMIEFLDTVIPVLESSPDVEVSVSADAPQYRPADAPPVISVGTSARADDRDWFDLEVSVSIDGEEIPFDGLFRALATGQQLMILESGTYFSLDRPELHALRRLIEEARSLQDAGAGAGPLGISPFQADLWEELQALGIVAGQAAAWRETVSGLTDVARIPPLAVPEQVQATLRAYQQSGFEWLGFLYDHQLGGILADDMGLGKTLQTIALMERVREQPGPSAPFLVVAPTSVVSNWAAECARFAPGLRVEAITETAGKRSRTLVSLHAGADVVVTSYTLFRLDFGDYDALAWSGLLLDEAQFVKNHKSRAHQCARRLTTPFKLAITGTPLENNLMEFWSLLSITAPGLFPSPGRFVDYYQKPIEKDADGEKLDQLRRRIRPFMLRRTKEQVAGDLPAKQEQVLEVTLHPKHRVVYDTHLQRERQKVLGLIDDLNSNRFEIFRSLTMLRQLSLDASLYDEKYADTPSTKLDVLLELLGDIVAGGHRTLIFSQFTQYLGKARTRLDAAGISYSYLDGKTRNRAKVISDFKTGDDSVFLISLKAGGFGLNLTEADYAILLDPWWNPATEAQAVDRMHRIGQTKNVFVYRLVSSDTIEEKVMALKATKARLFESVMTDGAARGTALTAADIRELLA